MIKIGIDIDDCICNTKEMDFAFAYNYLKEQNLIDTTKEYDQSHFDIGVVFDLTKEDCNKIYIQEKKFIMKHTSMYPMIFAKEVINALKKQKVQIYIITSRLNMFWKDTPTKYAKKWLNKYKIKYDRLFTNVESKLEACKNLKIDLMIEDSLTQIESLNKNNIKTILLKQSYNKNYKNKNNTNAETWLEIYHFICTKYSIKETLSLN